MTATNCDFAMRGASAACRLFPNRGARNCWASSELDPLEASAEEFRAQIANRRARIKALLMDQIVFRGMGNIYTDESSMALDDFIPRDLARI